MTARLVLVLILLAVSSLWPTSAKAQSCSLSTQSLAFGVMGSPTVQRDATANVTVSCAGSAGTVRVCLAIDAGSAPMSTISNRLMNSGGNSLSYQITTTPGGANWGIGASSREVFVVIGSGGGGSTAVTMYGRIGSGQNVPAASYSSMLQVSGRVPSGNSPCSSNSGSSFEGSFTATASLDGTCNITASPVNFGTTASLATAQSSSGSLSVTCSPTMPYSIALNAGTTTGNTIAARRMSLNGSGPGIVSYQLYQDSGFSTLWGDGTSGATYPGTGTGTVQSIPVHGRVPVQATPAAGTYNDTITATITY